MNEAVLCLQTKHDPDHSLVCLLQALTFTSTVLILCLQLAHSQEQKEEDDKGELVEHLLTLQTHKLFITKFCSHHHLSPVFSFWVQKLWMRGTKWTSTSRSRHSPRSVLTSWFLFLFSQPFVKDPPLPPSSCLQIFQAIPEHVGFNIELKWICQNKVRTLVGQQNGGFADAQDCR